MDSRIKKALIVSGITLLYCRFLLHTIRQRNAERRCHNYCSHHLPDFNDSWNHWRLNCQLLVIEQVRRMA